MNYRFDKARVAHTLAYSSVALTMLEVSMWLTESAKTSTLIRYIQQLTYIITAVFTLLALLSLRKLIPKSLKRAIFEKLFKTVKRVTKTFTRISARVLKVFGIKPKSKKMRDEKSFIFGDKAERRQKKVKSNAKWRELEDNSERIRFVYVKYIAKAIKDGYRYFVFNTPREVRDNLSLEDYTFDYRLFELYNGARYSGGSVYISDEQLESALKLIGVRKRI